MRHCHFLVLLGVMLFFANPLTYGTNSGLAEQAEQLRVRKQREENRRVLGPRQKILAPEHATKASPWKDKETQGSLGSAEVSQSPGTFVAATFWDMQHYSTMACWGTAKYKIQSYKFQRCRCQVSGKNKS